MKFSTLKELEKYIENLRFEYVREWVKDNADRFENVDDILQSKSALAAVYMMLESKENKNG